MMLAFKERVGTTTLVPYNRLRYKRAVLRKPARVGCEGLCFIRERLFISRVSFERLHCVNVSSAFQYKITNVEGFCNIYFIFQNELSHHILDLLFLSAMGSSKYFFYKPFKPTDFLQLYAALGLLNLIGVSFDLQSKLYIFYCFMFQACI